MSKRRKKRGKRAAGTANLNVWIAREVVAALRRYVADTEPSPTLTSAVQLALTRFLTREGYLDPPTNPTEKAPPRE